MKEEIQEFVLTTWKSHRAAMAGTILGLVLGFAVLLFGFWKTLFVLLCGIIGMFIGSRLDRGDDLLQGFREFWHEHKIRHRWK